QRPADNRTLGVRLRVTGSRDGRGRGQRSTEMTDVKTPRVPISKIDVEEGFNARTHMDEKELEGLAASLGSAGVVQPLSVRPGKGDRFTLVAGHRRLAAAPQAGLKDVPIVVSEGNAHLSSLVENIHREELDPIDAALGMRALAESSTSRPTKLSPRRSASRSRG
ncbi:MAG: ParB/RepB/Spo0J family partition protein, partial [Thermoleophilia bacterium]